MVSSIVNVLSFALIPAAAIVAGGSVAAIRTPGPMLRSAVQHFTSGLLFAVVATELLPDVMHRRLPLVTIGGFALGVAVMLWLKWVAERFESRAVAGSSQPSSLFLVLAVDGIELGLANSNLLEQVLCPRSRILQNKHPSAATDRARKRERGSLVSSAGDSSFKPVHANVS